MDVARAMAVLDALRQGTGPSPTIEESAELEERGFVTRVDAAERAGFEASAARLESARQEVRDGRRAIDLLWGPKSKPIRGELTSAQLRLQRAMHDLETASLAAAALASLVPNPSTGSFLRLELDGRECLEDLRVWSPRLGSAGLAESMAWIGQLRGSADAYVGAAQGVATQLAEADGPRIRATLPAAIRSSALQAALSRPPGALLDEIREGIAFFLRTLSGPGETPENRLTKATLLATIPQLPDEVLRIFKALQAELATVPLAPEATRAGSDLLAAALTPLAVGGRTGIAERIAAIAGALGPRHPLTYAALAGSLFSPSELAVRDRGAVEGLGRLGYQGSDAVAAASAILAASPLPIPAFASRLADLDPFLRGCFPSAATADALLASLPLSPSESVRLFEYAVGAVSRASFFEATPEVDYLALVLTAGLACGGLGMTPVAGSAESGASGPVAATIPAPPPVGGASPLPSTTAGMGLSWPQLSNFLFANYSFWMLSGYVAYSREHPLHSNRVPVYG